MSSRQVKGMTNAEIDAKLNELVVNMEREARKAVKRGGNLVAGRLKQNTPRYKYQTHKTHAADVIGVTNVKMDGNIPTVEVGFKVQGDSGWYIHFPNGGTTVRGTVGQPPQHFLEKSLIETKKPILALYRYAVKKGAK